MVKRILYATDLGLYGPYIMKQVAILAQSTGASVDILHVIEPMGVFAESIINTYMPEKEQVYLQELRRFGDEEPVFRRDQRARDLSRRAPRPLYPRPVGAPAVLPEELLRLPEKNAGVE